MSEARASGAEPAGRSGSSSLDSTRLTPERRAAPGGRSGGAHVERGVEASGLRRLSQACTHI
ncbi:hypothetical protein EYF80_062998 [Liparis tanakae]|uniref:Uncharacterized protein n=1 Tax=Liparis tanakae TaxID=230148 RepID=A0A4Z2EE86_9TELE|nr:hypothetical protein EYF80_062998 [Liparis tanakae]